MGGAGVCLRGRRGEGKEGEVRGRAKGGGKGRDEEIRVLSS